MRVLEALCLFLLELTQTSALYAPALSPNSLAHSFFDINQDRDFGTNLTCDQVIQKIS